MEMRSVDLSAISALSFSMEIPLTSLSLNLCLSAVCTFQLMIAQLLTAVYMVVMVIVIIGMALQFAEEGLESPSAIFFLATMGSFVVTGESRCAEYQNTMIQREGVYITLVEDHGIDASFVTV